MKQSPTKIDKKYGVTQKDIGRGFTDGDQEESEKDILEDLFEKPPGGFLGRSKGWER